MSELDEAGVEAATDILHDFFIKPNDICTEDKTRIVITAYLAAAARSTPDAYAMERDVIEPSDECPLSERVDGKLHTWRFDGDDPYVFCHWCGEYRDSLTNRVIRPGRKAVSR